MHRCRSARRHRRGGALAQPDGGRSTVMTTIAGVFREAEFSPGRVADDAAILERTAAALTARGVDVRLGGPELALADDVDAVLAMCQSPSALAILDRAVTRVPVLNSARAIRSCFRAVTVRLL